MGTKQYRFIFIGVLLAGSVLLANGNYISAKAWLAQYFIERAWHMQIKYSKPTKPWPWADTHVSGKLDFANLSLMVLEGTNLRNLAFGPTRLSTSATTNELGNIVIFGHRDTHFAKLQTLTLGEQIRFTQHITKIYEVSEIAIVDADAVEVTFPTQDDVITLITCYPFDELSSEAELRYIVRAHAIKV
ncbi:class GN sortase [Agaribacter flavus]|uniref:Class GN sortase n=1 Tax=Agaribacter flavus TaxID=1902781 RepID=A0ABV7FRW5_9ALTE